MHSFGIVARIDHLPRLLSDLAGLARIHGVRAAAGELILSGIWVEHRPDADATALLSLPDRLSSPAFPITTPLELSGVWAVCTAETPGLTRAALLDRLVDVTRVRGGRGDGRFVPVFHELQPREERQAEWQALASRHPGVVLPPLEQSRDGSISFTDIGDLGQAHERHGDGAGDARRVN
jgi:hypothetical protein